MSHHVPQPRYSAEYKELAKQDSLALFTAAEKAGVTAVFPVAAGGDGSE